MEDFLQFFGHSKAQNLVRLSISFREPLKIVTKGVDWVLMAEAAPNQIVDRLNGGKSFNELGKTILFPRLGWQPKK